LSTPLAALALGVALSSAATAQAAPVRVPGTVPGHTGAPHQEPCWQVAGISKAAMEQHRSILQSARSQVEAVCADSSLTAQQRSEKIRQIHQQAKQQADAIVTPQQMQSLKSCQSSRGAGHPSMGGGHHAGGGGGGSGPCGQLPGSAGAGASGSKPPIENDLEN
jgi:hypothetical protein